MEKKLKKFIEDAFEPYGPFPAKEDVINELYGNLLEKYNDYKKEGLGSNEAYEETIESFGDVSEIMEQVAPEKTAHETQTPKETFAHRLRSMVLKEADLSDTHLVGADLSSSQLTGANFEGAQLENARINSADTRGASFKCQFNERYSAFFGSFKCEF